MNFEFFLLSLFRATSDEGQNDAFLASLSHPTPSPFLYVEKSLQLFAKRIAASLHHLVSGSTTNHLSDSIRDVLKPEVKKVQVSLPFSIFLSSNLL
jgi:hypothetical protein